MPHTVQIQVSFTIEDFTDALYFSQAEYAELTAEKLEAMQQVRLDAWKAFVNAPPVVPAIPTPEEVAQSITDLTQQQRDLQAQVMALADDTVMAGILTIQKDLIDEWFLHSTLTRRRT